MEQDGLSLAIDVLKDELARKCARYRRITGMAQKMADRMGKAAEGPDAEAMVREQARGIVKLRITAAELDEESIRLSELIEELEDRERELKWSTRS